MTLPDSTRKEMDALPAVLRTLLEAELAAGNSVAEIGHSFPAPPIGAYFKLAHTLLTRPRASGDGIDYYNRNHSAYSGEITDAKRHFFLLEPPAPPEPEPNMDDICAVHVPDDQIPKGEFKRVQELKKILHPTAASITAVSAVDDTTLVGRFRRSMVMDYDKWHDGTGYDLSLIKSATPDERAQIETILINRDARDWRDIEALAALNSPAAHAVLKTALNSSKHEISMAVMNHAPELVPGATRVRMLVAALRRADFYGGLSGALAQVETFHPPEIIAELFHGALERPGDVGVHFAAMLMFLHGKAENAFDWAQRPFFLRFNTTNRREREAAFIELCEKIGAPADRFAQHVRAPKPTMSPHVETQANITQPGVPVFDVEIDVPSELLTYQEPKRCATVSCTFAGAPRLSARTLSDWLYPAAQRSEPMTDDERAETLNRIMDFCRNRHGMLDLQRDE